MPRPKTNPPERMPQRAPLNPRGGRKPSETYTSRCTADPDGSTVIRIPNRVLVFWERQAEAAGITVPEWLSRQEIESRIL